ncbi:MULTISPECIES: putative toxin-antitoxin system toxin component, PIN family [Roseiflexus]|jgi:putative PIN family toxin of toxin-antitoxin system|uniref:PilT protein domain protein n=1 Tax=Roseiflexus castenholzii (strain DSM 13941 / HLO8) TaxID=383372 RepID=A7NS55_ROSCS|nr:MULTISPECIES: putative toxin-antitoxin system toxin component, PIN family [Roseiflexus]ABU60401.1 PilT protein domain protein [Roseiflexus castenholzii DSM 13941]GIV82988.1 MAG: PIN domain-containing protein [Anaerolineae bacterium]GIV98789.1 MAG: PIN domain-containing protein [Roseiflexus sp.]
MANEPRFVFDTNVVISALLLRHSVARQAFDRATRTGKLLVSGMTIEELNAVLRRKGFERYVTEEERMEFLSAFVGDGVLVEIVERVVACRDPKDDKFLELAINGKATCIVSGDEDLLILHPFRGIAIVTPRQFLEHPI